MTSAKRSSSSLEANLSTGTSDTSASSFYDQHAGHDVGWRHEDGSLYSATCHDCGAFYQRPEVSS